MDATCGSCGADWTGVPSERVPLETCPLCDGTIDCLEAIIGKALRRRRLS